MNSHDLSHRDYKNNVSVAAGEEDKTFYKCVSWIQQKCKIEGHSNWNVVVQLEVK